MIGLQPDRAIVHFDSLLDALEVQKGIAEVGQGHREAGLQRDGPLQGRTRVLIFPKCEMRGSQIGKCLCRAWVDRYGIFECLFRCLELSARECAQAKQVQGAEMLRKFIQDLAAERLGLRIPALAIGRIRGRNDRVRLLLQFLLQPRVLERARAGAAALQDFLRRMPGTILADSRPEPPV